MSTPNWNRESDELFQKFLSFWPLISRPYHEKRMRSEIESALAVRGSENVSSDVVLEAIRRAYPSYETFALALENPAAIAQVMGTQKSINETDPLVKITRWDLPDVPISRTVDDVFALLAGPRIGGNTDCIMDAILDGVRQSGARVEKVCCSQLNITPCTGCLKCQDESRDGYCALQDDMTPLYARLLECDAFVLGFPIYTARESSHTAIFFDRLKALSNPASKRSFEMKKGAIVSTWGWPSAYLYENSIHTIAFLLRHFGVETAEVVTGCGFWDAYYARGSAALDTDGIEQARSAGRSLASAS